jgi:dephospho-CoA kinase
MNPARFAGPSLKKLRSKVEELMSVNRVNTKPHIIGLTGGIGSGKTTAAKYLESIGLVVIDSDQIVRELYEKNTKMKQEIESLISFRIDTTTDKKRLADMIFDQKDLREKINAIIHPLVYQRIDHMIDNLLDQEIIIIDMPLLFEVGYEKNVDDTLLIYVPKKIQIKRIKDRNPNLTHQEIEKRILSQMPLLQKKKRASFVIDNRYDKTHLYQKIDLIIRGIKNEKQQSI